MLINILASIILMFSPLAANTNAAELVRPDYSKLTANNHPRLFFTENDFKKLKKEVSKGENEGLGVLHKSMMYIADKYGLSDKEITFDKEKAKRTFNDTARHIANRIVSAAYAYRVTGEKKYLDHVLSNVDLFADNFRRWTTNYWLENSEVCYSFALVYDWLYKSLPKATKDKIVNAIASIGYDDANDPKKNNFYKTTGNWNPVCNASLVCAAIATYEKHPEASAAIIEKAIQTVPVCLGSLYEPDGASPEGPSYWDYASNYAAQLCMVLQDNFGSDFGLSDFNGFKKGYLFRLFAVGNTGQWFNYGDCNPSGAQTSMALWFYAWKFGRPEILFRDIAWLRKHKVKFYRAIPMSIACALRLGPFETRHPKELILTCKGEAELIIARGGWKENDAYLGMKGGIGKAGHSHLDQGSFVYEADGLRWVDELLHPAYELYRRASRDLKKQGKSFKWYDQFAYNNRRHSTITVNDTDMNEMGVARIVDSFDTPERRGGAMDLTDMFYGQVSKAVRSVALIDGHDLEIKDDIEASRESSAHIRWTLVTGADVEVTSDGIILSQKGKKMIVKADFPVTYRTWSADPADYDDNPVRAYEAQMEKYPQKLCGFEFDIPAGSRRCVTVKITNTI